MAKRYTLEAVERTENARSLRHSGNVPGILYGHGLSPKSVAVNAKQFLKVLKETGSTTLVSLKIGDKQDHQVLIRETQLHPLTEAVMHVDFYQVRLDEAIHVNVPLVFIGESLAVKDHGGTFVRNIDEVEVEALPQDLPHNFEVDISLLDTFDKVIRVDDLNVPAGVKILLEDDEVIALVQKPRSQEEIDAELAEEVKEDVESVEGVVKPEPGAEEAAEGADAPKEEAKSE